MEFGQKMIVYRGPRYRGNLNRLVWRTPKLVLSLGSNWAISKVQTTSITRRQISIPHCTFRRFLQIIFILDFLLFYLI